MDSYEIEKLPFENMTIFVASTTGDGESPDNMKVRSSMP
jgi:sulfite reductase alpha subunit-like flavoprotein